MPDRTYSTAGLPGGNENRRSRHGAAGSSEGRGHGRSACRPTVGSSRFAWRCWARWLPGAVLAAGFLAPAAGAAVQDLNQATRAEIEAVRGVGVELTDRLLQARAQAPFTDWSDLRRRVKGVSRRALAGFAEAGFQIRNRGPEDQN